MKEFLLDFMSVLDKSISIFFVGDIYDRPMESHTHTKKKAQ